MTINGGPFTYNGSAQAPATVSVTGAGGLSLAAMTSYANNVNAGTATATLGAVLKYREDQLHASRLDVQKMIATAVAGG